MIVCHRHRFIFIKTRKTASSSMEVALSRFCGPDDIITPILEGGEELRQQLGYPGPRNFRLSVPDANGAPRQVTLENHTEARVLRQLMPDVWAGYFKFCFERNPFDKAISRYWWELRRLSAQPSLAEFIANAPEWMLSNWGIYAIDGEVAVDWVGRYESMQADLEVLSSRIGLPDTIRLPEARAKASSRADRRSHREVLRPAERARIETLCRREMEAFGYAW